jgi:hypothetical protein
MQTYFVYHCSISEINVTEGEVNSILEAHTEDSKIHTSKENVVTELRDILDKHCNRPLYKEIERLNRVVAVLDRRLADALTVSV